MPIYRSAKTGKIVTEAYALQNPDTTVRERMAKDKKKAVKKPAVKKAVKPVAVKKPVKVVKKAKKPADVVYSLEKAVALKEAMLPELRAQGKDCSATIGKVDINGTMYDYVVDVKQDGTHESGLK